MNEITKTTARTPAAGGTISGIVPVTLDEMYRFSKAISSSGMAPYGLTTPEQVMIAMQSGMELGLPPMQAVQSVAVINNRPCLWGDALIGVVRSSPSCKFIKETIEGEGDDMVAYCSTLRAGEDEPVVRSFSVDDAKKAGLWQTEPRVTKKGKNGGTYEKDNDSPWYKYPKRMLQMRARAFCLRDVYGDVLKGMQVREEVEDYSASQPKDVTPEPRPSMASKLAGTSQGEGFSQAHITHEIDNAGSKPVVDDSHDSASDQVDEAQPDTASAASQGDAESDGADASYPSAPSAPTVDMARRIVKYIHFLACDIPDGFENREDAIANLPKGLDSSTPDAEVRKLKAIKGFAMNVISAAQKDGDSYTFQDDCTPDWLKAEAANMLGIDQAALDQNTDKDVA